MDWRCLDTDSHGSMQHLSSRFTKLAWQHILAPLSFRFTDMAQVLHYISFFVGTMFISSSFCINGLATY